MLQETKPVLQAQHLPVHQHLDYFQAAYNIGDLSYAHDLMSRPKYQKYRNSVCVL